MNKVHVSIFSYSKESNGGVKRSSQLQDFFNRQDIETIYVPTSYKLRSVVLQNAFRYVRYLLGNLRQLTTLSFRGILAFTAYEVWIKKLFKNRSLDEVHIEVGYGAYLIPPYVFLTKFKAKVNLYPHNIEFLVPGQKNIYFHNNYKALRFELSLYKKCFKTHTISSFDKAVLNCLGIDNVNILNYAPTKNDLDTLKKIKEKRKELRSKEFYIILGSVVNIPTRYGTERLLNEIVSSKISTNFKVVGYGTEVFSDFKGTNIDVLGGISDEELCHNLIECKGVLISQRQTSGMLTRIADLAEAEVPIVFFGDYIQAQLTKKGDIRFIKNITDLS